MRPLVIICVLWTIAAVCAAEQAETFARHLPLVTTDSMLLDAAHAGHRLVAVGEHGAVLLSDDDGRSWRQAKSVPTRTTLTAVAFVDTAHGWTVGHGGQILATVDGGETWQVQHGAMAGEESLFSVWFNDGKRGIAVGPYGYALSTRDGGLTWTQFEVVSESEDWQRHLNCIFSDEAGQLYIAAESGVVYLSDDDGVTWRMVEVPYEGSLWGGESLRNGDIIVFGMSGHAFSSTDRGTTWREIPTNVDQSLTDAIELDNGLVVLVGLNGAMSFINSAAGTVEALVRDDHRSATSVLATPSALLLLSERGILEYPLTTRAHDGIGTR